MTSTGKAEGMTDAGNRLLSAAGEAKMIAENTRLRARIERLERAEANYRAALSAILVHGGSAETYDPEVERIACAVLEDGE